MEPFASVFCQRNVFKVCPCCSMYQYFIFLLPNNIPLYGYHILFIHSLVNQYLDYFHLLTTVNSVAMNFCI